MTENVFNSEGNNDGEIWRTQLFARMKSLQESRPTAGPVTTNNSDAIEPVQRVTAPNTARAGPSSSRRDTAPTENSITLRQEIPQTPPDAATLVALWRKGCPEKGFRPVHLYDKAEMRKIIVTHYSDKKWTSSGQKRAYQRFKRLAVAISRHNDNITDIFCEGSSQEWRTAVEKFEIYWDVQANKKTVSTIERELSRN